MFSSVINEQGIIGINSIGELNLSFVNIIIQKYFSSFKLNEFSNSF